MNRGQLWAGEAATAIPDPSSAEAEMATMIARFTSGSLRPSADLMP
jgi:hypothetical protein